MKQVRKKKILGAVIGGAMGLIGSLGGSAIGARAQRKAMEEQRRQQQLAENEQRADAYVNNLNEIANADLKEHYSKFAPVYRFGGNKKFKDPYKNNKRQIANNKANKEPIFKDRISSQNKFKCGGKKTTKR